MNVFLLILQILLVIGWYVVPALAVAPAWAIFLPLMIVGAVWALMLVVMIFFGTVAAFVSRR